MIEIFDRLTFHKNMYTKPCYSHDVEKNCQYQNGNIYHNPKR